MFKHTTSIISEPIPVHCFRTPPEGEDRSIPIRAVEDKTEEEEQEKDDYLLCRQCHHIITSLEEHVEINGAHQHAFANPHGIVFEIGCFKSAFGCGYTGPATDEFSWFNGFKWRIAICGKCIAHIGWLFVSSGDVSFNGLILDRLIRSE